MPTADTNQERMSDLVWREVGVSIVLRGGTEPTPLETNVLCRVSVGRVVTLNSYSFLLPICFILSREYCLRCKMIYLLLVTFQLSVEMQKVIW